MSKSEVCKDFKLINVFSKDSILVLRRHLSEGSDFVANDVRSLGR